MVDGMFCNWSGRRRRSHRSGYNDLWNHDLRGSAMTRQDDTQESSRWDRAYEAIEELRKLGDKADPSSSTFEETFVDLTKSSGSRD